MRQVILGFMSIGALSACSSVPKYGDKPENSPDIVISRIDDLKERPDWLQESTPFKIEAGKVVSMGSTEIPLDHRIEAAYRIAQNNAKAAVAGAIEQRLEFILQNAQEGTASDTNQIRYIGAEASKLTSSSLRPEKVYWEKYSSTLDSGERVTKFRVFATVTIPEADFKRLIFDAIQKAKGKGSISNEFKAAVESHWSDFTRAPANE